MKPTIWLICALSAIAIPAQAEVLEIPQTDYIEPIEPGGFVGERDKVEFRHVTLPGKGMTKDSVEARFGSPSNRTEPVGEPPITLWRYDNGFTVYFEYDHVIHAVTHNN